MFRPLPFPDSRSKYGAGFRDGVMQASAYGAGLPENLFATRSPRYRAGRPLGVRPLLPGPSPQAAARELFTSVPSTLPQRCRAEPLLRRLTTENIRAAALDPAGKSRRPRRRNGAGRAA